MKKGFKIARCRGYKLEKDPQMYYYEQIFLFYPWFDEEKDILAIDDYAKLYFDNIKIICKNKTMYEHESTKNFEEESERLEKEMTEQWEEVNEIQVERLNRANERMQKRAEIQKTRQEIRKLIGDNDDSDDAMYKNDQELFEGVDPNVVDSEEELLEDMYGFQADPNEDANTIPVYTSEIIDKEQAHDFLVEVSTDDQKFNKLMINLNRQQHKYVLNVVRLIISQELPFYHVLIGGSGTGKSFLIKALTATANRLFNIMDKYVRAEAAADNNVLK